MTHTVAIIGGGITGLTAAYSLVMARKEKNLSINIILLEAQNRLGGVIKSETLNDFILEHGPDSFLINKASLKTLIANLNLSEQVLPINAENRQAFIAKQKKLVPLPSGFYLAAPTQFWSFVKSPLFSFTSKLRIALEMLLPPKKNKPDESVYSFLQRRFGKELAANIGQSLVGGIYMADINHLSAHSTLSQFVQLEQNHGSIIKGLLKNKTQATHSASGARYNLFASLKDGLQLLIDQLAKHCSDAEIHLNTRVCSIKKQANGKWQINCNNKAFESDSIVLALPAKHASTILSAYDQQLSMALSKIKNNSSAVVNLLFKSSDIGHPHKGFGFIIPKTENKKAIACAFISQKFQHRSPLDFEMIRVFLGGQLMPEILNATDEQLIALAQNEIKDYLQTKASAVESWLYRCDDGLPLYQLNHAQLVEQIEHLAQKHNGLLIAGCSYYGVGIPDCVASGMQAAESLSQLIINKESACLEHL